MVTNWKPWGLFVALWLVMLPAAVAAQNEFGSPPGVAGETKDRLSQDRMATLVSGPMRAVEREGLSAGKAAFERLLAVARTAHGPRSVEVADLLTSFGVSLYSFGLDSDDRGIREASLPYLEAAIPAYRAAFGAADPEVAVALNSYADAQVALHENDPPDSADAALEEAYRIRLGAFGPANPETLASLRYLARLRGDPARTRGDRAHIDAAAELYRQLITRSPNDPQMGYLSSPYARSALARMYARNGMPTEAREQLRLAVGEAASWPIEERCLLAVGETADVEHILSGEITGARATAVPDFDALDRCLSSQ